MGSSFYILQELSVKSVDLFIPMPSEYVLISKVELEETPSVHVIAIHPFLSIE